ncbi:MAG TPA: nitroreductase/quinone reductase family protein [Anaerolineae bacterium]|jgi:deazaflavin-dependent oxidoreductase (nitroreductase family)
MDEKVVHALQHDQVIDITTTGRKTGELRRIEIWFHNVDGRLFITGTPGKRSWFANLAAHPGFTFHLKQSVQADLPARARVIAAEPERRAIMTRILAKLNRPADLEEWVSHSPLVEVTLQ